SGSTTSTATAPAATRCWAVCGRRVCPPAPGAASSGTRRRVPSTSGRGSSAPRGCGSSCRGRGGRGDTRRGGVGGGATAAREGPGMARAIARRVAAEGAQGAVADLNRESAERVAAEIHADGGTAIAVPADVAESAQVDALFARVVREWQTVDILCNNAGIGEL